MLANIGYINKEALYENANVADKNKVKADDMNEIKTQFNGAMSGLLAQGNITVESITGKNLFNKDTIRVGQLNEITGEIKTNMLSDVVSDFIDVKNISNVFVYTYDWFIVCFYDINKSFISGNNYQISDTGASINIPLNVKYLRMSTGINSLDTAQIESGNERTPYTPYKNFNAPFFQDLTNEIVYNSNLSSATKKFTLYKYGNILQLAGYVAGATITANTTIFTIPSKYLNGIPEGLRFIFIGASATQLYVAFNSDGTFVSKTDTTWLGGNGTWIIKEDSTSTASSVSTMLLEEE